MIVTAGIRGQKLKVLLADRPGNKRQDRLSLRDFLRDEQVSQGNIGFTNLRRESAQPCRHLYAIGDCSAEGQPEGQP